MTEVKTGEQPHPWLLSYHGLTLSPHCNCYNPVSEYPECASEGVKHNWRLLPEVIPAKILACYM